METETRNDDAYELTRVASTHVPAVTVSPKRADAYELMQHLWRSGIAAERAAHDAGHANGQPRKFYASNVGGCLRASVYNQAQVPPTNPFGEGLVARMQVGSYIEGQILDLLDRELARRGVGRLNRQARVENAYHVAVTDAVLFPTVTPLPVRSNGSLLHRLFPWLAQAPGRPSEPPKPLTWFDEESGSMCVCQETRGIPLEVKSVHPLAMDRRTKELGGKWLPYDQHVLQLSQFLVLAREVGMPVADYGVLLYISLDGRRRVNTVHLSTWERELKERWGTLEKHLATGELPPRLDRTCFPCAAGAKSKCQYFDHCWADERGHIAG